MALADVASRLYSSASYRNVPVSKALIDAVKMNIKFRFSLVGMAAALTGSQTLFQVAQQKYLITDEEKKQEAENLNFKKYVVTSISTLSRQVALIESVVEKNSMMINAIAGDLGYFRGQRRLSTNSYGSLKSFRAPVSSRTVKGKIDIINAEIAALKGIRVAQQTAKQKEAAKEVLRKDKDKQRGLVAAAASATLAALGLGAAGAGAGIAAIGAGAAGIAGGAIASQIGKQLVANAIPIVGKAFKISLGFGLLMGAQERMSRRGKGMAGIQTGAPEDYTNTIDPKTDPIGYKIRQNEIDLRKSIDTLFEEFSKPIDAAIAAITTYLLVKSSGEFADFYSKFKKGKGFKFPSKIKNLFPTLSGATSTAAAVSAATAISAGMAASGGIATGVAAGAAIGGRVWTGKMWKTIPTTPAGRSLTQAPKSTKIRRFLPPKFSKFMKGMSGIKGITKFLKGPGALAAAGSVFYIANLFQATSAYESGDITLKQFEESFVTNVSGLLSTGAATAIGGALGAVVGGPLGLLLGGSAGLLVGFLGTGTTDEMATKLFELLYAGEIPATETIDFSATSVSGGAATSASVAKILATIKQKESGGNYAAQSPSSSASGAYQFTDATWKSLTQKYGVGTEYPKAKMAPQQVQDTVAEMYVNELLVQTNNDITKIPLIWYTGNTEGRMTAQQLAANKGMTAQTYQADWLNRYNKMTGESVVASSTTSAILAGGGLASTLDAQIMDFFIKNASNVQTIEEAGSRSQPQVVDEAARAAVQMLSEVVITSKKSIDKTVTELQRKEDMKKLEDIAYVDDYASDELFEKPNFSM